MLCVSGTDLKFILNLHKTELVHFNYAYRHLQLGFFWAVFFNMPLYVYIYTSMKYVCQPDSSQTCCPLRFLSKSIQHAEGLRDWVSRMTVEHENAPNYGLWGMEEGEEKQGGLSG